MWINRLLTALQDSVLEIDFALEVVGEAIFVSHFLEICVDGWLDFDFNFVTNTILALDMLGATKASEDASTDHDSHLCRQSFCLLHRMGRENDRTLLVSQRSFPRSAT